MAEVALSLPFSIDSYGNVVSTTDPAKIWSDRVRAVIGTNLRERLMNPEFGTLVPSSFMETTDFASSLIQAEVQRAFSVQLPLLSLTSTSASYDEYSGLFNITILYDLPNNETVTTTVTLISIDGTTTPTEESL